MIEDTSFTFPAGYRSTIPARSSKPCKILVSSVSFLTFLTSSSYSWVVGSGKLSIQQTFRFEISEPLRTPWNATFRVNRPDPSHHTFAYRKLTSVFTFGGSSLSGGS